MSEAPEELWADWDYEDTDGVCGVHTCKKYASGYEPDLPPIRYVRSDRIEELEAENETLRKALEIYQRERDRYRHATPEMSGAYFLSGGHGPKDNNQMPQFVEVVPAYGCGWSMVYEDTGRTISYEGS